jgi:hypothetical protein
MTIAPPALDAHAAGSIAKGLRAEAALSYICPNPADVEDHGHSSPITTHRPPFSRGGARETEYSFIYP